uniref:Transposase of IS4/5 family (DUF4096) n=1 Tax=Candidatus Kentrum sp. TUN TaxID=2126343 RepID=A0A451AMN7_9GAMM|nr:MAG: Putative transposase of IS4/5 family (DUF4096) [Candidatus Kentron sp. TUN]VFK67267.1 MAG: Putative transposase of IS4/5 family (DUF4096) [Candidatus Kentron sp. TUN]
MYDSDLSAEKWALIEHHFEPKDNRCAESRHDKRIIVNAILYISKTGAQ